MLVITNIINDPYFNLASEEYMLSQSDDVFMLWRNSPAVIIGKNQNAYAEVNTAFTRENNIAVVRRLTGGGAVFHDLGNINFTFITDAEKGHEIDFKPFILPITKALGKYGITACADGRNDIICDGYKISGNAQCVFDTADGRKRLLHHGTLLFSADLKFLCGALNVSKAKLTSKGIKSVRSRVINIASLDGYTGPQNPADFVLALERFACENYGIARPFTDAEAAEINKLADEKYRKWDWNFGMSPAHTTEHAIRFPFGEIQLSYTAAGGVIESISIHGDFFGVAPISELENKLVGTRLDRDELAKCFVWCEKYITGSTKEDLLQLF